MAQTSSCTTYRKRTGTTGISGQLYESKLISLLYFRAIHDKRIAEFQLASNFDNIGAFDDICFKAKVEGLDKPVLVFIQAKHKENEKQTLTVDLATYFDSYLKIRHTFESSNNDLLFNGTFDKTECLFVIYTNASPGLHTTTLYLPDRKAETNFISNVNDLIKTCGKVKQPDKNEENVECLSKIVIKGQVISLAQRIAELIMGEQNFQMMSDELVLRYNVILAQKVFKVSEIIPDRKRIALFRDSFFNTNEEYLILFKNTLYKEILKRKKKPADVTGLLSEFLADYTDATRLSKLIVTVLSYNNGQLELLKEFTKYDNQQLKQVYVSRLTVNQAIELAAKDILLSKKFKVPAEFGNKDITIRGNNAKIEKRMNRITSKIKDLLSKCNSSNIVTIDESFEKGLLGLNGGIASAIGNIFVLDDDTKLMKVTDKCESLGDLAKSLYQKLIEEIHNLHEYKFSFRIYMFPKLSFDHSDYEENLAKDFLNKLLFYSSQANETGVEKILKREIEDYQLYHENSFKAKTDAIFLKYHDNIQKWWMQSNEADYLTKDINEFEKAIHNIKDQLSAIKEIYMSKIRYFNYEFNKDTMMSLKLLDQPSTTVIITENIVPTVVKVMQYLKDKKQEQTVLDLEYIVDLPAYDRKTLSEELENTNKDNVIIIVCDKIQALEHKNKTLEYIAKSIKDRKTIVINNAVSHNVLKKYFPKPVNKVLDVKNTLNDFSERSQKTILESARLIFQGKEVKLSLLVNGETMAYVKGDILNKIVSKETIEVSVPIVNRNYEEIKHLYVERSVRKAGHDRVVVGTLNDIADDIVLVTADPGMGKSTLLTHLSLKTKEVDPKVWIVRINLLECSEEFSQWNKNQTTIDTLETLKFMCQVILRRKLDKETKVQIALEQQNDVVYLQYCTGDQWTVFELKLFLHLYNKREMIFLFDGFDEVCPHYINEVIKFIKTFSNNPCKPRMWITSRSYNQVKSILEREFGSSYEIDCFSNTDTEKYLESFWESNLRLEEFNSTQLENVKNFIEYISSLEVSKLNALGIPLPIVYLNAVHYLINEIKYRFIPLWTYDKNYNDSYDVQVSKILFMNKFIGGNKYFFRNEKYDGNPLHLLLAAAFVKDKFKSFDNIKSKEWNISVNLFSFYEQSLKTMMEKRFQEKNEVDLYRPVNIITYDKEFEAFVLSHKKMAAYAILNLRDLEFDRFLNTKDLEEIEETIKLIEKGEEKTGLIYSVANKTPIFIHMTFTEYLAVEYFCDCLKNEKNSEKQTEFMSFIFGMIFFVNNFSYIRAILDHKIKVDKTLMTVLENNKNVIFDLLMLQGHRITIEKDRFNQIKVVHCETEVEKPPQTSLLLIRVYTAESWSLGLSWALSNALHEHLHNFILFFVKILKCYINKSNLNHFLYFVENSDLSPLVNKNKNTDLIIYALDIVRKMDESKFTSVLYDHFRFLPHSTISSYLELSTQEIIYIMSFLELCTSKGKIFNLEGQLRTPTVCPPSRIFWMIDHQITSPALGGAGWRIRIPLSKIQMCPSAQSCFPSSSACPDPGCCRVLVPSQADVDFVIQKVLSEIRKTPGCPFPPDAEQEPPETTVSGEDLRQAEGEDAVAPHLSPDACVPSTGL